MGTSNIKTVDDLLGLITKGANWIFLSIMLGATLFFLVGAFYFLLAGANEENVTKGVTYMKYSAIAVAAALVAGGVTKLISNLIG